MAGLRQPIGNVRSKIAPNIPRDVIIDAAGIEIGPVPDRIGIIENIVLIQIIAVVLIVLANKRRVVSEESIESIGEFSEVISVWRWSDVGGVRSAQTVIIVCDVEKVATGIKARLTITDLVGRIRAGPRWLGQGLGR